MDHGEAFTQKLLASIFTLSLTITARGFLSAANINLGISSHQKPDSVLQISSGLAVLSPPPCLAACSGETFPT